MFFFSLQKQKISSSVFYTAECAIFLDPSLFSPPEFCISAKQFSNILVYRSLEPRIPGPYVTDETLIVSGRGHSQVAAKRNAAENALQLLSDRIGLTEREVVNYDQLVKDQFSSLHMNDLARAAAQPDAELLSGTDALIINSFY